MNNNAPKKIETRGRKPKKELEKQRYQVATRLTKKEYFAWKIWVQGQGMSEAEAIRTFVHSKIKELSFEDIMRTAEISLERDK